MPPPGDLHGGVEAKFTAELVDQGDKRGMGKTRCGEVGIILWRDPDRVVGADAIFIANGSLPIQRSTEGYLLTIPDLVVEIRSKNDTLAEILAKVADYLRAGVRVVWVADPEARTVAAHRPDQEPKVFQESDTLTVEEVIPGFRMAVKDVFAV